MTHLISADVATRVRTWLNTRGGVAVWGSLDLANPGRTFTTPAQDDSGKPYPRPHWSATATPTAVYTDPTQIGVVTYKEVKRFHVAVRRSSNGLALKLTDAASRRVIKAVAAAGEGAAYVFDYATQEAVILEPGGTVPLSEWVG